MIKYMTEFGRIEKVDVIKETEKSVVIQFTGSRWGDEKDPSTYTRRQLKSNSYQKIFDTWKDAHDYLLSDIIREIEGCKNRLANEEEDLKKIKAMKEE